MLYVLYGDDDFTREQRLKQIKAECGDPEFVALNSVVLDGAKLTFQQLKDACGAVPFMGGKRLVIVDGLLAARQGRGRQEQAEPEKQEKNEWRALPDYVSQMTPSTVLVLLEGELRPDNTWLKRLAGKGEVQRFRAPQDEALCVWVRQQAKAQGLEMSAPAAEALAACTGPDLRALTNEIAKLALYTGGKPVTVRHVAEASGYTRETSIFDLSNALVERDPQQGVRLLHRLLDEGATAPYVLAMLGRQLRMATRAKELMAQGADRSRLGQELKIPWKALDSLMRQARGLTPERLAQALRLALEADLAIKTGRLSDETALELLVAGMCYAEGASGASRGGAMGTRARVASASRRAPPRKATE